MREQEAADSFEPAYHTGTAARLAGVPVETLRVWERRYRVVGPRLSPRGHRLYTADDVARLTLIRQLVDLGSPIGSVAGLPVTALRDMRRAAAAATGVGYADSAGTAGPVRVAFVGSTLAEQASRDGGLLPTLDIVATCTGQADAAAALSGVTADVVVIDLPTLQPGAVAMVDDLVQLVSARNAIVAYRFAPTAIVDALREHGHIVVRAPLDLAGLEQLCRDALAPDTTRASRAPAPLSLDAIPPPRFDDQSLARLAQALVTLYCECPRHVADLLLSLGSFERYSAECANRNPADAVLHRYLQSVAGSARALFEDALIRVARAEGLALPAASGTTNPAA